ncbi:CDGSH iron-sulfur domain-containing protein [Rhodococcus artemisiae]|uniref:CDGSH iron-sulfur domain-containing protein n=1 Tax=Rhodococcus artemisiae TaxID=714159 RepID=A0ABU7LCN8_9NOCA|nr:CDGSH iron-sulfur domain-containing protein [Rhodococcus artemisiae]MEE2059308.1 CDGSH iron-sulfur domain-containing protein [Rhodococcus artemisiae]
MHDRDDRDVRVVRLVKGGPALVEGPIRIVAEDGSETESDRFVVAVCRCRRSALYPLCDTSHRRPGHPRG